MACRPREDNPYLLLEEMGEGNTSDLHTELGLVQSDSYADIENGRGNDSPISIDRNFSIGDLEDEEDSQKPAIGSPPSPRRPNKNAHTNQHSLNDSEQQSQSSSPRHSRPVPPPKPSGKKD